MTIIERLSQNYSVEPLPQTATRCRLLGIDQDGTEHVHDRDRNRVVALDAEGIHAQYLLDDLDQTVHDWMHFVADRRGWAIEQWVGYKLAEALFRPEAHG
ncbi:MAG: hypothetical protein ABEJ58_05860 [Halodesulfurarchaeum sp.]